MVKGKHAIVYILLALACLAVAGGCGNKRIDNEAMEEEFENAPEWVLTGHDDEIFSAVGSARIGKSGMQFAKTAALAYARNELANQLAVKVHALVNTFTRQMGVGDEDVVDRMGKQVSKQVARETLNGSRQKDVWISPSSDLYVLVVMDKEAVRQSVRNQMVESFKESEDQWERFRTKQGEARLDQEMETLF